MKKIEAIIRSARFEHVKDALYDINVHFFTYYPVHGIGNQQSEASVYRGIAYSPESIRRTKIEIFISDYNLHAVIDTIIGAARTDKVGDGRIAVHEVSQLYNIRTGELKEKDIEF